MSLETDGIQKYLLSSGVPHKVTSVFRPGTGSRHNVWLAVDFAAPVPFNNPVTHPPLKAIFDAFDRVGNQLFELIYSGAPYYIKRGIRKPISLLPATTKAQHWNHVHVAVDAGILLKWQGDINMPDLPKIKGPVELHIVVNPQTGICSGYYIFSPTSGELHGFGAGAPYLGRSEVIS